MYLANGHWPYFHNTDLCYIDVESWLRCILKTLGHEYRINTTEGGTTMGNDPQSYSEKYLDMSTMS